LSGRLGAFAVAAAPSDLSPYSTGERPLIVNRAAAGVAATVALIAVMASCGGGSGDVVAQPTSGAGSGTGAEPVVALKAASPAPGTDAPASACTSRDVALSLGEDSEGGYTGDTSMAVRFTNEGLRTCVLEGRPTVQFLDSDGNNVGLREDENGGGRQYVHGRTTFTFRLPPGSSADVAIAKYRCDVGTKTYAAEVKIGLPDTDETTTLMIDRDTIGTLASCLGGDDDPGQTFAISGYTPFTCHLVGNATGGGWCDGELGRQPAQTPEEAARADQKAALARQHSLTKNG